MDANTNKTPSPELPSPKNELDSTALPVMSNLESVIKNNPTIADTRLIAKYFVLLTIF